MSHTVLAHDEEINEVYSHFSTKQATVVHVITCITGATDTLSSGVLLYAVK